mgnify:CR=1 FL=1
MHKPKRFISVLAILAFACALMFTATAASADADIADGGPGGAPAGPAGNAAGGARGGAPLPEASMGGLLRGAGVRGLEM